jgi:hypothetical protein
MGHTAGDASASKEEGEVVGETVGEIVGEGEGEVVGETVGARRRRAPSGGVVGFRLRARVASPEDNMA